MSLKIRKWDVMLVPSDWGSSATWFKRESVQHFSVKDIETLKETTVALFKNLILISKFFHMNKRKSENLIQLSQTYFWSPFFCVCNTGPL